jgi:anthranilate phosphoribosyltransferase
VVDGSVRSFDLSPEEAGLQRRPAGLGGGDAAENAALMLAVLAGENQDLTEAVLLNAGAALLVSGRVDSLAAGVEEARHQIQSGAARRRLDEFGELTRARAAAAKSREGGA